VRADLTRIRTHILKRSAHEGKTTEKSTKKSKGLDWNVEPTTISSNQTSSFTCLNYNHTNFFSFFLFPIFWIWLVHLFTAIKNVYSAKIFEEMIHVCNIQTNNALKLINWIRYIKSNVCSSTISRIFLVRFQHLHFPWIFKI